MKKERGNLVHMCVGCKASNRVISDLDDVVEHDGPNHKRITLVKFIDHRNKYLRDAKIDILYDLKDKIITELERKLEGMIKEVEPLKSDFESITRDWEDCRIENLLKN
jgi:hypothetical protein